MKENPRLKIVGGSRATFAGRENLIAYLEYAVAEVGACNETSASFLIMAIAHLQQSMPAGPPGSFPKFS